MSSDLNVNVSCCIVIHHLTDVHIGPLHFEASRKLAYVEGDEGTRNLALYLEYLRTCSPDAVPHLVIISGDLTSYGTAEEFAKAKEFIRNILKEMAERDIPSPFGDDAPKILIVPGNHDLDWKKSKYKDKIDSYCAIAQDLYAQGVRSAISADGTHEPYFDFGDESNLFIYLFNTTPLGGTDDGQLKSVHETIQDAAKTLEANTEQTDQNTQSALESQEKFAKALATLRQYVKQDPGYITGDDLTKAKRTTKKVDKKRFKLAVMHHNSTSVPVDDIETFDTIINAGMVNSMLINSGFDVVLHGHRHFPHATNERYLSKHQKEHHQGILVIGGASQGCEREAPFFELRLHDTAATQKQKVAYPLLEVRQAEHMTDSYQFRNEAIVEEAIDRNRFAEIREIQKAVGRKIDPRKRGALSASLAELMPSFAKLWSTLLYWDSDEYEWIKKFHVTLFMYSKMYMVDIQERSSLTSPSFDLYLTHQYEERLRHIRKQKEYKLYYPSPIFEAILETGWRPLQSHWWGYIREKTDTPTPGMGMVRILVRSRAHEQDEEALIKLDFDHRAYAIPLFVIEPRDLGDQKPVDMGIGFSDQNMPMRSFEYMKEQGRVEEVTKPGRADELVIMFETMLGSPNLQTVQQYLARKGPTEMLTSASQQIVVSKRYNKTRKASPRILELLREKMDPNESKKGLDVACGTGNYTFPFVGEFGEIVGLDISEEMLEQAKLANHDNSITFRCCDALDMGAFKDGHFDCLWGISALHYFSANRQKRLFAEMSRVLKPNGVLVVDTEFAEQHASLWLVKFFPSLIDRFRHRCKRIDWYKEILLNPGGLFKSVEFEYAECDHEDAFLRVGQRTPEKYLDKAILEGIPAFCEMDRVELEVGLESLEKEINDGSIIQTMKSYEEMAELSGDIGFIIARR